MTFEQMAAACRFIVATLGDKCWFSNPHIQIFADSKSPFVSIGTPYKTYIEVDTRVKFVLCEQEQVKLVPEVRRLLELCLEDNLVR